jgi:membrane protease subunit HflK
LRFLYYLLGIALLLSLLTGLRAIEPGEKAVVLRFGRVVATPGPGLYVGLPWGIDQVYRVAVNRTRSVQIGYQPDQDDESGLTPVPGQLVTGDHNLVNIQAILDYVVRENEVEHFVFQQERAEELLARTAESVLSQWVATHGVDTVILKGKVAKLQPGHASLRDVLMEETQKRLDDYQLGVEIKDARLLRLDPPPAVKDAFDEVYQAETQIKTLEYQAKGYATRIENEAKSNADDVRQKADGFHYQKIKQAERQAESFEKWVVLAKKMKAQDPYYLNAVWWDQVTELYALLKANGQIDLLDHRLGAGGLDLTIVPNLTPKK